MELNVTPYNAQHWVELPQLFSLLRLCFRCGLLQKVQFSLHFHRCKCNQVSSAKTNVEESEKWSFYSGLEKLSNSYFTTQQPTQSLRLKFNHLIDSFNENMKNLKLFNQQFLLFRVEVQSLQKIKFNPLQHH